MSKRRVKKTGEKSEEITQSIIIILLVHIKNRDKGSIAPAQRKRNRAAIKGMERQNIRLFITFSSGGELFFYY